MCATVCVSVCEREREIEGGNSNKQSRSIRFNSIRVSPKTEMLGTKFLTALAVMVIVVCAHPMVVKTPQMVRICMPSLPFLFLDMKIHVLNAIKNAFFRVGIVGTSLRATFPSRSLRKSLTLSLLPVSPILGIIS